MRGGTHPFDFCQNTNNTSYVSWLKVEMPVFGFALGLLLLVLREKSTNKVIHKILILEAQVHLL